MRDEVLAFLGGRTAGEDQADGGLSFAGDVAAEGSDAAAPAAATAALPIATFSHR